MNVLSLPRTILAVTAALFFLARPGTVLSQGPWIPSSSVGVRYVPVSLPKGQVSVVYPPNKISDVLQLKVLDPRLVRSNLDNTYNCAALCRYRIENITSVAPVPKGETRPDLNRVYMDCFLFACVDKKKVISKYPIESFVVDREGYVGILKTKVFGAENKTEKDGVLVRHERVTNAYDNTYVFIKEAAVKQKPRFDIPDKAVPPRKTR